MTQSHSAKRLRNLRRVMPCRRVSSIAHAILLSLSLIVCWAANAATQGSILQQLDACNAVGNTTPDARYAACTAVIDSGLASDHGVSAAYDSRGLVRLHKQELDRAVEDFNQAIQKDPENAAAFNNRGVAYQKKQEFERAIAD